eukprot:CAMPEP_0206138126 /NCGR_PEP_ID=MMETSP1473-20131121/3094_1 /ASSEMBLY_ACC=CAM_ASM_001109 /TAXON_ID=1461547 /ORGANISM="Stichococcus sp, Strain RCC1054" /LENGTH=90 /DNA_ID=CAMNT_0053531461 /DNA_START=336 /DNA_END=608 /DNA_ORIENTATION=+
MMQSATWGPQDMKCMHLLQGGNIANCHMGSNSAVCLPDLRQKYANEQRACLDSGHLRDPVSNDRVQPASSMAGKSCSIALQNRTLVPTED